MPKKRKCMMPFCPTRGSKEERKTIILYSFPAEETLRLKWKEKVGQFMENGADWKVEKTDFLCGLHFVGGKIIGNNNVPTIFTLDKADISEDIPNLTNTIMGHCDSVEAKDEGEERHILPAGDETENKEELVPTGEKVAITTGESEVLEGGNEISIPEKTGESDDSRNSENLSFQRISSEVVVERSEPSFYVEKFRDDNEAINVYTGLPDYQTFVALFNFVKPKDGFHLVYHNHKNMHKNDDDDDNNVGEISQKNKRGRPRILSQENELFLTLCRLRQGLIEVDLHHRFGVSTTTVSEIFLTWLDRLNHCLNGLDQIPGLEEGLRSLLPDSFKGGFEDIDLIIDCTEINIEKPSDTIIQSATWSEYKSHNTGKVLVGVSPVGFPRFVSDGYPGSISDDDITAISGILKLARRNKRWLADKGWQCDGDEFGLIIETPGRLEGKLQFSEAEDQANRRISRLRIHVERLIRRIKVFRILKKDIPLRYANVASQIVNVCARLTAFLPPLIKETDVSFLCEE